jgi:hypothetical protein
MERNQIGVEQEGKEGPRVVSRGELAATVE